ncbi:hypothetical protein ACIRJM_22105 [Streptomyces sp. NPDC102405]|uniref:hypothetical protein n=1 Tax=Streptomyces sp. NPDC102405 TaxID=3366170 RepID=UPI00381C9022
MPLPAWMAGHPGAPKPAVPDWVRERLAPAPVTYVRGDHVELVAEVTALGYTARPGEMGEVEEVHTGGLMTVRLENGRRTFPYRDEVTPVPR